MASFLMTPLLSTSAGRITKIPAKQSLHTPEKLNETMVIVFLTLGPVIGAAMFLAWLGGLVWGVLSSLF